MRSSNYPNGMGSESTQDPFVLPAATQNTASKPSLMSEILREKDRRLVAISKTLDEKNKQLKAFTSRFSLLTKTLAFTASVLIAISIISIKLILDGSWTKH